VAFVIGWNLILEYAIGTASVARGYSGYLDSLLNKSMEHAFRNFLPMDVSTERLTDLGKLNLLISGLSQFTHTVQASSKNVAQLKSGQNWLKNNQIALLI